MIVRDMTNRILIAPGEGGPAVELHGVPAWIQELYEGSGGNKKLPGPCGPGGQLSLVAEARNQRYLQLAMRWIPRIQ